MELALALVHRVEDRHRPDALTQVKRAGHLDVPCGPSEPCLVACRRGAHEVYIAELLRLLGEAVLGYPVRRRDHHLDAVVVPHRVADKLLELLGAPAVLRDCRHAFGEMLVEDDGMADLEELGLALKGCAGLVVLADIVPDYEHGDE